MKQARPGLCHRGAKPRHGGRTKGRRSLETHDFLMDEVQGLGPWRVWAEPSLTFHEFLLFQPWYQFLTGPSDPPWMKLAV